MIGTVYSRSVNIFKSLLDMQFHNDSIFLYRYIVIMCLIGYTGCASTLLYYIQQHA